MADIELRREFAVFGEELAFLDVNYPGWESVIDGNQRWLLLHGFSVPKGYTVEKSSMAIALPEDYPNSGLDMVYFYPELCLSSGRAIKATETRQQIKGNGYQRWSRHYSWSTGRDSIITHVLRATGWLERELVK